MTYEEVFYKRVILANIPLVYEGRKLPKSETASVMLMRVACNKIVDEFQEDMRKVEEDLKKEGFSERSQAIAEMEDIDRRKKAAEEWKKGDKDANGKPIEKPGMPTKEELEKAEKTRETKDEYDKELKELEDNLNEIRGRKLKEKVDKKGTYTFSRAEYAEICEVIGYEGDIEVVGFTEHPSKTSRVEFLSAIASNLVAQ